ncbi:MAG: glycosyltransferase, partial [Pseudomonadota bacterium]
MTDLIVGICTFRRPSVIETIKSVDAQIGRRADRIIVVDNDDMPTAQQSVEALSLKTPITYIHASGRNISIARNACLDAAGPCHFAFLDDDETASPEWLTAMVDAMAQGHQAVFG